MTTLSETNGYYHALEAHIAQKLLPNVGSHTTREAMLLSNAVTSEGVAELVNSSISSEDAEVAKKVLGFIDDGDPLPTRFDDKLTYALAKRLTTVIQCTATGLGFDDSGYGGFCCAPTGLVNAQAVPIRYDEPQSKVFIVFESGLFTFIHGIVSTVVAATPDDLLAGESLTEWNDAWSRHVALADDDFTSGCVALSHWVRFFSIYDRSQLSFVGLGHFGPAGQRMIHDMTTGCEFFVTAHEFVHAVSGHQDPSLDATQVEKEADSAGAVIASKALYDADVGAFFAVAGICLFLRAVEAEQHRGPHMSADERIALVIRQMLPDDGWRATASDIAELYSRIFRDMLDVAVEVKAAS